MSTAIAFALSSLVFAGLVDLSYKRYSRKPRSRGLFLCAMGVVWLGLQLAFFAGTDQALVLDGPTWRYGLAAGLAVTLSNLLLIESMTGLDVSLGSTVYRLNTIGVVILAFIFLGETLAPIKLLGIASGIVAVLFLYEGKAGSSTVRVPVIFLAVAVCASVFRASYSVISKAGLEAGANIPGLLLIAAVCWMVGGIAYAWWRESGASLTRATAGYGLVAGLLVFGTVNTLIRALEAGDASLVVPIANLGFLIALTLGVIWKMERLTWRKGVAMAFAVAAIFLLSRA